jgi:hypothetical protein
MGGYHLEYVIIIGYPAPPRHITPAGIMGRTVDHGISSRQGRQGKIDDNPTGQQEYRNARIRCGVS